MKFIFWLKKPGAIIPFLCMIFNRLILFLENDMPLIRGVGCGERRTVAEGVKGRVPLIWHRRCVAWRTGEGGGNDRGGYSRPGRADTRCILPRRASASGQAFPRAARRCHGQTAQGRRSCGDCFHASGAALIERHRWPWGTPCPVRNGTSKNQMAESSPPGA